MKPVYIAKSGSLLLRSPNTDPDLRRRLECCGMPTNWGWSFCRTPACHRCRVYRTADWIQEAVETFGKSRSTSLRFLTIMLDTVANPDQLRSVINRGKVALRNIVHRLRQDDPRAGGLRMTGAIEVDWFRTHHVPMLTASKIELLDSIGFDRAAPEVWMPHFHLLVDLAGTPERKLADLLRRKWSGHAQVHIEPLKDDDVPTHIEAVIGYGLKHHHFYKVDPYQKPTLVAWSDEARVRFYNALFKSGGFSMIRFNLKPARSHEVIQDDRTAAKSLLEPMPMTFL